MFIATTLEDVIQIEPADFTKRSRDAIEDNINALYANKIIHKIGLCICFYDLLSASDGLISANKSGIVNVKVTFRLIVFRPFRGEILEAKISNSSEKGIYLHTEFFSDIFIPGPQNLFPNCTFDQAEQVWIWTPEVEEGAAPTPFYFDKHELVRFRVEEEIWTDLAPGDEDGISVAALSVAAQQERQMLYHQQHYQQPQDARGAGMIADVAGAGTARQTELRGEIGNVLGSVDEGALGAGKGQLRAWRLVGSMQMAGLGVCSWWESEDEEGAVGNIEEE